MLLVQHAKLVIKNRSGSRNCKSKLFWWHHNITLVVVAHDKVHFLEIQLRNYCMHALLDLNMDEMGVSAFD